MILKEEHFSLSTAQEEAALMPELVPSNIYPSPLSVVPPGLYRVIDGQLFRLRPGLPGYLSGDAQP